MHDVLFVTGNANKFYEASTICATFDITLVQQEINLDEIQHHDAIEITKAKIDAAWSVTKKPTVVNDSSWNIPALGGFPGGYMKDVTAWLSTADFALLLSDKKDKRIFLHETVAYKDDTTTLFFTHNRLGHFVKKPAGQAPPTFARLVEMEGEGMTISQVFDRGNWQTSARDRYKHWYDFAQWYNIYVDKGVV